MPSFVVVAGADVEMADLESGNISARIDLNLHLAPPTAGDLLRLRLGSGPSGEEEQQQQQQQPQQQQQQPQLHQQQQRHGGQEQGSSQQQRRILPRFGPGIHGVFLDLHQEPDLEGGGNRVAGRSSSVFSRVDDESLITDPQLMRAPFRHRIRRYARPVRIRDSRRLPEVATVRTTQPIEPKEKEQVKGDLEDTKDDESSVKGGKGVDNYECNVCFEVASDPVLTVCGHLFCWQCLYQWLYVHSDNEECPVCKGWVGENSIIPIYGRGSTPPEAQDQSQADESRGQALPPRPQARRLDSPRQTLISQLEADTAWDDRPPAGWMFPETQQHAPVGGALPPRPHHRRQSETRHRVLSMWNERTTGWNEMLRMGRAIRLLSTRARLRRRLEREQHYRAATTELDTTLSSDELPLSLSRAEGIQARLANLVETIESHRRAAASMVARLQETDITPGQQQTTGTVAASTSTPGSAPAPAPAPTPASSAPAPGQQAGGTSTGSRVTTLTVFPTTEASRREVGEGSGTSGSSDDIDIDPEMLHCRKRRRLN